MELEVPGNVVDRIRRFSGSRVQTTIPNEARVGSSLYVFDLFMGAVTLTGCLYLVVPTRLRSDLWVSSYALPVGVEFLFYCYRIGG